MGARPIPAWQLKYIRRSPRISYVTPVELLFAGEVGAAKSCSLSKHGMLVETDCPLPLRARIHLYFALPGGRGITTAARVVHARGGRLFGLEFLEMDGDTQEAIEQAIGVERSRDRRSIRLPERLFVNLDWQQEGVFRTQVAETALLSRHGCLALCTSAPPEGACLQLDWPEKETAISARVVSVEADGAGPFRVALEFTDDDDANFWEVDWPEADS
jgi:hypothetical protein